MATPIFSLPQFTWPRCTPLRRKTPRCTNSDDSTGDREFDSNFSYFLILIKACSILVCIHFRWFFCPFTSVGDKYSPLRPKSIEVHPTNSQSVSLPMMHFENVNGLPPIHKAPLRPLVEIMAHLVVSDLFIYPFSFKEPTHI